MKRANELLNQMEVILNNLRATNASLDKILASETKKAA